MKALRSLLFLAITALCTPALLQADIGKPTSIDAVGSAQDPTGRTQMERLRESHLKDLALNKEVKRFYGDFEALAQEWLLVPQRDMKDIWKSGTEIFRLTPNNLGDARDVAEAYRDIFERTKSLKEEEAGLDALGEEEKGNKEKNRAIKDLQKKSKKNRKAIENNRKLIKKRIKSILQYDKGDQEQGLTNWLMVSYGLLRDEREAREAKVLAESIPPIIMLEAKEADSALYSEAEEISPKAQSLESHSQPKNLSPSAQ